MRRLRRYLNRAVVAVAGALAASSAAMAHPHAWIDVKVDVVFDGQGRVAALKQTWLFDVFYSEFAMQNPGVERGEASDAARLAALLDENIGLIAPYEWFTRVEVKKAAVAFSPPTEKSMRLVDGRIEMAFVLTLATPAAIAGSALDYLIFDPSYYIEMLHADNSASIRLVDAPDGCTHRIAQPRPSAADVTRAAALDQVPDGPHDIGIVFAQRVTVQCGERK